MEWIGEGERVSMQKKEPRQTFICWPFSQRCTSSSLLPLVNLLNTGTPGMPISSVTL